MEVLLVIYLVTKMKENDHVMNLLEEEVKMISFINLGLLISTGLYRSRMN